MSHAPVRCPKCKGRNMLRLERKGLLQSKILPLFGFFPWKCYDCRMHRFMHVRGDDFGPMHGQDLSSR